MTKRKSLWAGSFLLTCFGAWYFVTSAPIPDKTISESPAPAATPFARSIPAAREVAAQPTQIMPIMNSSVDVGEDCANFWNRLVAQELPQDPSNAMALPLVDKCKTLPPASPSNLRTLHVNYSKQCAGGEARNPACQATYVQYWAALLDWQYRDIPLERIDTVAPLAAKLMVNFSDNPMKAAQVADRILELPENSNPISGQVKAAAAKLKMMVELNSDSPGVQAALQKAQELNPKDPQIAEADLFVTSQSQDSNALRGKAEQVGAQLPDSGLREYYLSMIEFRAGNLGKATDLAGAAAEKDPRFLPTVQRLKNDPKVLAAAPYEMRADFFIPLQGLAQTRAE